jgi:hypothetical protein
MRRSLEKVNDWAVDGEEVVTEEYASAQGRKSLF